MARRISTADFAAIRAQSGLDSATLRAAIRTPITSALDAHTYVSTATPATPDVLAVSEGLHVSRATFFSQLQNEYWIKDNETGQIVQAPCPDWFGYHRSAKDLNGNDIILFSKDTKQWEKVCKRYLTDASNDSKFRWEKDSSGREYRHIDLPVTMAYYVRAIELGNLEITIKYASSFTGDKVAVQLGSLHCYSAAIRSIHLAAVAYNQRSTRYDKAITDKGATFDAVKRSAEALDKARAELIAAWAAVHKLDISDELAA